MKTITIEEVITEIKEKIRKVQEKINYHNNELQVLQSVLKTLIKENKHENK